MMAMAAFARCARGIAAFLFSAGIHCCVYCVFGSAMPSAEWTHAAGDNHRTPFDVSGWASKENKFTENSTDGCTGQGTDGYTWRNVGWGSNVNCKWGWGLRGVYVLLYMYLRKYYPWITWDASSVWNYTFFYVLFETSAVAWCILEHLPWIPTVSPHDRHVNIIQKAGT